MDNFILYDEISKGPNSIIYKGRRKGSINFLAIHCIEKMMRPEITNLVRLTYEIANKNIVKFYEWYETSNHLWLVVELCTAGTLEAVIRQDACLPESSIRQFGVDICEGLHYIHSLGILFCDLHPRKIMIDGNGTLKLGDFGLSKLEGETLEEVLQETVDASYKPTSAVVSPKSGKLLFGDANYMAPEIINGDEHTKSTDLWSLGCILYEMYAGHSPFTSDNLDQTIEKITIKDLPNPKGNKLSTKPSTEFLNLLKGLLEKDVSKRLTWKQVIRHAFWEGKLLHLMPMTTKSIMIDGKETIAEDDQEDELVDRYRLSTDRPKTSAGLTDQKPEMNVSFSMSSRLPVSPQSTMHTRNPLECKESDESSSQQQVQSNSASYSNNSNPNFKEYRKLFFLFSESNTSQIIDNAKIQKPSSLKFEPKSIPITNNKLLKAETLLQIPREDFYRHLDYIKANTTVSNDKSAVTIKSKLQLMNYIGCLCTESEKMADEFIGIELYKDLVMVVKSGHNLEMKMKAARILAILFSRATKLDAKRELTDISQSLIDIISANRKDVKLKQALLPTLGELLYVIASQEAIVGKTVEAWAVPQLAYLLIVRSIGEDLTLNHIVCKIIEKIASTNSVHVQKFIALQSDLVNSLWSCYAHSSNNEQLRVTVLNAFCQLTSHSVTVFQSLIDKIGVDTMLDTLSLTNTRIQQATLTMLSMYINECNLKSIPEKKLISKITPIYDCTNLNCRSKVYLLTYILLKQQNDLLIQFANTKLINSVERDFRKNFNNKEENEYIHKILGYLVSIIINICTANMDELIATLESVNGRKNPSSLQTKQLKRVIPHTLTLKLLFASQTFRSRLLDEIFVQKFGKILHHSKFLVSGELNLDSICGNSATFDYMNAITSILEMIGQTKEILQGYSKPILESIVPTLIENIDATNSDLSVESLRTLSEICGRVFHDPELNVSQELKKQMKSFIENFFVEKLDKLLVQPEPLPYFALIIVESVFNYDLMFVNSLRSKHILPPIFKLLIAYKNKISSALTQKILNVIALWSALSDPSDLYENGIVDCLRTLFIESQKMRKIDEKSSLIAITEILKILDNLLKYVSEFVKKALQAKKVAGSGDSLAQQAERLLHSNKPLIGICPYLISLLVNDDNDIAEFSSKVLWIVMQLFGGECKDLLNPDNLSIFMQAITTSNFKRQKILLRIVKRIITADKSNLEVFKTIGHSSMDSLKNLKLQASAEANITLSSLIDEILKLV